MKLLRLLLPIGLALCLGLLRPSASAFDPLRVELSDDAMGTTFSVVLHGPDSARLEAAAREALDEAQRIDRLLSNYLPSSEWSEVNRSAAARPVHVSQELFDLVSACVAYSRQSEGAFDISVGPLMKVWGFYKGEGLLPRPAEISQALNLVGYQHLVLDSARRTILFDRPGVEIDPGGIGKGYAVDRMVDVLRRRGVEIALVSAGGSSVYGLGAPPDEPAGWPVPIRAPGDPQATAATVRLKNQSISTSGSYEKFFRAGGRVYSHIMDPRTGYPAQGTASVSVVAPRTIDSEAWTKPYFVNGRAWTAKNLQPSFRVFFCNDTESRACSWIGGRVSFPQISSIGGQVSWGHSSSDRL